MTVNLAVICNSAYSLFVIGLEPLSEAVCVDPSAALGQFKVEIMFRAFSNHLRSSTATIIPQWVLAPCHMFAFKLVKH